MKRRVYKSLDKSSSLFGLQGSYLRWAIIGIIAVGVLCFILSRFIQSVIALILFIALAAGVYIGIIGFQARFSERERDKWLSSKGLPDIITMEPVRFEQMTKGELVYKEKGKKEV